MNGALCPVVVAVRCPRSLTLSGEDMATVARLICDANPLHTDGDTAARAHHDCVIADRQQTTLQTSGLIATHFTPRCDHCVPKGPIS